MVLFLPCGVSLLTSLLCGPTCCFLVLVGLEDFFFFLLGIAKGWVWRWRWEVCRLMPGCHGRATALARGPTLSSTLGMGWHKMPCLKSNRVRSHAGPRYRVSSTLLRIFSPVGLRMNQNDLAPRWCQWHATHISSQIWWGAGSNLECVPDPSHPNRFNRDTKCERRCQHANRC